SEDSLLALDYVSKHADPKTTELKLLSVIEWDIPAPLLRYVPDPGSVHDYKDKLREKSVVHLQELAQKYFPDFNVSVDVQLSVKSAATEITKFLEEHKPDILVLASHGRGEVGTLLLGSVVQKIIRMAPCPVLVVPKPLPESA
ncbi:MAG: universal stress protein, partial [Bdellovibrionales bacterium]|nr:universal stress protein [Bdellovibrionales bacterium]